MPYENPYAAPESNGSGTAVPDNWTTVPSTNETEDSEPDEEEVPGRRDKGKNRAEETPPLTDDGF